MRKGWCAAALVLETESLWVTLLLLVVLLALVVALEGSTSMTARGEGPPLRHGVAAAVEGAAEDGCWEDGLGSVDKAA